MDIKGFIQWIINNVSFIVIVQPWEKGLRVRFGKHITELYPGVYLKIPYFDAIYVKEDRLRICSIPIQTVTSEDKITVTIDTAVGYRITDLKKLYLTMFHPETNIQNNCMALLTKAIRSDKLNTVSYYEDNVLNKLKQSLDIGIQFEYFAIKTFAEVRTYRIIQDHSWVSETLNMTEKK